MTRISCIQPESGQIVKQTASGMKEILASNMFDIDIDRDPR